jgi:hypothetical protein
VDASISMPLRVKCRTSIGTSPGTPTPRTWAIPAPGRTAASPLNLTPTKSPSKTSKYCAATCANQRFSIKDKHAASFYRNKDSRPCWTKKGKPSKPPPTPTRGKNANACRWWMPSFTTGMSITPKKIWQLFQQAGTPAWDAAAQPYLPVTGLKSWNDLATE